MANPQKEVWELTKAARKQGWRVKETKKGYLLFDPSGQIRSYCTTLLAIPEGYVTHCHV